MSNRNLISSLIHDLVVRASAATYVNLRSKGYEITTNPGSLKNRFVGGQSNPLYPDVIVWRPSDIGSTSGQAVLIEEIETEDSVNSNEGINQWKYFGQIGVKFLLIVPLDMENRALEIIKSEGIRVDEIWTYSLDQISKKYRFVNSNLLPQNG